MPPIPITIPIPNLFLEAPSLFFCFLNYFGFICKINVVVNASSWWVSVDLNFCWKWSKLVWISVFFGLNFANISLNKCWQQCKLVIESNKHLHFHKTKLQYSLVYLSYIVQLNGQSLHTYNKHTLFLSSHCSISTSHAPNVPIILASSPLNNRPCSRSTISLKPSFLSFFLCLQAHPPSYIQIYLVNWNPPPAEPPSLTSIKKSQQLQKCLAHAE